LSENQKIAPEIGQQILIEFITDRRWLKAKVKTLQM